MVGLRVRKEAEGMYSFSYTYCEQHVYYVHTHIGAYDSRFAVARNVKIALACRSPGAGLAWPRHSRGSHARRSSRSADMFVVRIRTSAHLIDYLLSDKCLLRRHQQHSWP